MKRSIRVLPIIITIALLALGAAMPRLTALTLDRKLEMEIINLEDSFSALALAQEADFFKTLALFNSDHTEVKLSEGYNMTAEEAEESAMRVVAEFEAVGIVYTSLKTTPLLYSSKDTPGLSGVFWHCEWETDSGAPEEIYIDDQTGLVVSLNLLLKSTAFVSSAADGGVTSTVVPDAYPKPAEKLADYCRQNYPVNEVNLYHDENAQISEAFFITLIREKDGRDETFVMEIYCGDYYIMSF